jgi:hypothetical protein
VDITLNAVREFSTGCGDGNKKKLVKWCGRLFIDFPFETSISATVGCPSPNLKETGLTEAIIGKGQLVIE